MTIDEGDRSGVFLSLTKNAWPPWAFPLPGSTCAEVTPPEIVSSKESSWVLNPSMLLNHGIIGPLRLLVLWAPR